MNRFKILVVLTTLSLLSVAQNRKQQLSQIKSFLNMEYPNDAPGAVVLAAVDGNIIFEKAYGLASINPKRKMKTDMVFQVASITKQFVSAAILKLVEEGKMHLKDTIQMYVPNYPVKKYPITINHLLSQTSGIPEYFILEADELHLLAKEHTPEELINYYKNYNLNFKPGSRFEYSNSNYPLLGAALEKVTGMTLKEYLDIHFFKPLEMNSTGLWYSKFLKKKRIPIGYDYNKDSIFPGPKIVGSAMYAAGGLVSTAKDLFKWNMDFKKKSKLSSFIVEELTTTKTLDSGEKTNYGYGLYLDELKGSPTIQHDGNLYGFTASSLYLPKKDIYVCVLSNKKYDRTQEIANYIASVLIDKPLEILNKTEIKSEKLKEYSGTFKIVDAEFERTLVIKPYKDFLLLSDIKSPESDALLTPAGLDKFLLKVASATFTFFRDKEGKVSGFKVQQSEEEYEFEKVK